MVAHLDDAEVLAEALNDQPRLGQISYYMALHFLLMGDVDRSLVSSQRALDIAESLDDVTLRVTSHLNLGRVYYTLGDYPRAMDALKQNVAFLTGELLYERFGMAGLLSVLCRNWLCWCLAEVGAFAEGLTRGEEGVQTAEAVDDLFSLIKAYEGVGMLYLRKGNFPQAISVLERGLDICHTANQSFLFMEIAMNLGTAYARSGRMTEAMPYVLLITPVPTNNEATRRGFCDFSATSPCIVIPQRSTRLKPTTNKLLLWPTNSACAHFRPTVITVLAPCIARQDSQNTPVPNCPRLLRCTETWR
jgi:tetratricopeptide (TPR) repeat protein